MQSILIFNHNLSKQELKRNKKLCKMWNAIENILNKINFFLYFD